MTVAAKTVPTHAMISQRPATASMGNRVGVIFIRLPTVEETIDEESAKDECEQPRAGAEVEQPATPIP